MNQSRSSQPVPVVRRFAGRAFTRIEQFLHIEAVSGVALLVAALLALLWANSPYALSYEQLWHTPLYFGFGQWQLSYSLHFWVNDALMTVFFLVVGMEIRREMHDGSLASMRQVVLPMMAAAGGVAVPALVYLAFNHDPALSHGWAVPTATDIAFAVGVLAILGRSIPANVRIFLLTLAIIDDVIAVLIIALFYTDGLALEGFVIAGAGIVLVIVLQVLGISRAWLYVGPGALLWFGLLKTGAHPTLAGVVLGLMTPVRRVWHQRQPMHVVRRALAQLQRDSSLHAREQIARRLRHAQRELMAPVERVQMTLHLWVAYGVMPLFALANAGVAFDALELVEPMAQRVLLGVSLALVLGKPIGILLASWLAIALCGSRMPQGMNWHWLALVGCLGGIGFTMSIFIANLAFASPMLLGAAKLGVLMASGCSALIGLAWGAWLLRRQRPI